MRLKIATVKLQEMVARAIKGAGMNKLIPMTSLMAIELKDNVLTLITSDSTNYLYIRETKVEGEDFYVTVDADKFAKLVSRTTSENITLELTDNLVFKGNGDYTLELPLDDDSGELFHYEDPLKDFKGANDNIQLNLSTVGVILDTLKPALATTLEIPCYTGYYVGNKVVATDMEIIASLDVEVLKEAKLISSEYMDLLSVMSTEKIDVDIVDDIIVCSCPDCALYGRIMSGIEDFSIDAIEGFMESAFESSCKIPKSDLLQLLDRLSLFVDDYDEGAITLTFTDKGLQISSKASSGVEIIPYRESQNFVPFIGEVDIDMLQKEVKAVKADMLELHYGLDKAIKFVDGSVTIIVSLLVDEPEDE